MQGVSVSYIVSTMDRSDLHFIDEIFSDVIFDEIEYEIIVVNQSKQYSIPGSFPKITIVNTQDTGLSKSRNLGLRYASFEIVHFLDDDVKVDSRVQTVYHYLLKSEASVVTGIMLNHAFQESKDYKKNFFSHNYFSIMRVSSMECLFKKEVFSKGIRFREDFGLGSKRYQTGEENILLSDCLKLDFKVEFVPLPTVIHDDSLRDNARYVSLDMMEANGAVFSKIYGKLLSIIISFIWLGRKLIVPKSKFSLFIKSYCSMIKGIIKA